MTEPCDVCGFELYLGVSKLAVSNLGLYSDNRFPGRSILSLHQHYESIEELPSELLADFTNDIRRSVAAIKSAVSADRVDIAILGNAVPHVHAHLVPRFIALEEFPYRSPWNDRREKGPLDADVERAIIHDIRLLVVDELPR